MPFGPLRVHLIIGALLSQNNYLWFIFFYFLGRVATQRLCVLRSVGSVLSGSLDALNSDNISPMRRFSRPLCNLLRIAVLPSFSLRQTENIFFN